MPVRKTTSRPKLSTGSKKSLGNPFSSQQKFGGPSSTEEAPPSVKAAVVKLLPPLNDVRLPTSKKHSTASETASEASSASNWGSTNQRSARDEFKYAVGQVIAMSRLSGDGNGRDASSRTGQAPFGPGTPFHRVRSCLDPVQHRHLLGDDDVLHAASKKTTRRKNDSQSDDSETETVGLTEAERTRRLKKRHLQKKLKLLREQKKKRDAVDFIDDVDCDHILDDDEWDDESGGEFDEQPSEGGNRDDNESSLLATGNDTFGSATFGNLVQSPSMGTRKMSICASGAYTPNDEISPSKSRHQYSMAEASFKARKLEKKKKGRLPRGEDVAQLPEELAQTLMSVATEHLRTYLYPKMILHKRIATKSANREQAYKHALRPSVDFLKKCGQMWKEWPADVLQQVSTHLMFHLADAGDIVLHEGEPMGSGIYFLSHGSVQLVRRRSRSESKKFNLSNAQVLGTLHNSACFNEFQFLTEEPRLHAVKATTKCDMWVLRKESYDSLVNQLPADVRATIRDHCFQKRLKSIPMAYPMARHHVRQAPIFHHSSDALVDAVLSKLKPLASHAGFNFTTEGDPISQILFVRRGRIGANRKINGEQLHVRTFFSPCVLLDSSGLHRQVASDTLTAITDCDLFTLHLDDLDALLVAHPGEKEEMFNASREQHMQQLSVQQVKFRPLIFSIPIVRTLLQHDHINSLAYLFEGKVYSPMSVVCSTSEMCDRIIILVKGKISLGKNGRWQEGEAIGYTCVLPHRWPCSAVAIEASECIEIPRKLFVALLKDTSHYEMAREIVERLMFPNKGADVEPDIRKRRKQYAYGDTSVMNNSVTSETADARNRKYFSQESSTPKQEKGMSLDHALNRVRNHIAQLQTPVMFPILHSREGFSSSCPGFTCVKKLDDFGVDSQVLPGSIYNLTKAEKAEIVSQVSTRFKPEEQRRLTHITKYLMVKEKQTSH